MKASTLICFSLTPEELDRLAACGPRRDIIELSQRLDADVLMRTSKGARKGLLGKLIGPQMKHAWRAAATRDRYSTIFADGEHVGLPLAVTLFVRRRRSTRLVILGHYVDKPWKRLLLRIGTRLVPQGTLILHSATQAASARGTLGRGWDLALLPYQVDTAFWSPEPTAPKVNRPMIVSAGSENRDYQSLIEAVRELDVDLTIASGSHWARKQAVADGVPSNVTLLRDVLSFAELRDLYSRATVVVVPLREVSNQSGITTLLEGMSMAKPVVVSATLGQREVVTGPLVSEAGEDDWAKQNRGPQVLGLPRTETTTGFYVVPANVLALRNAIQILASDANRRAEMGAAARQLMEQCYSVEAFAERFALVIEGGGTSPTISNAPPVPA